MTTSFGSICLGSLIVAFLQAVRAMLRNARGGRGGMLSYLFVCFHPCTQPLIQKLNISH